MVFDPQSASFTSTQMNVAFSWSGIDVATVGRLEKTGVGVGFSITGPSDSIVQRIDLRFNLKQYQDEIVEETFCPKFFHATIGLKLPVPCMDYISAEIDLDRRGFDEMYLQLQPPLQIFPSFSLGTAVVLHTDGKGLSLSPSLSLKSSDCFDLYWGIDWNSTTNTFSGLKLYGIGVHGDIGGVRIHSLTSFLPDEIALVKSPYWELFGIVGGIPTCWGDGEVSVAFYLGNGGLFNLGELEVTVSVPLRKDSRFSWSVTAPTAGSPRLVLGWEVSI